MKSLEARLIPKECRIGELQHVWATWKWHPKKRIEHFCHKRCKRCWVQIRFISSLYALGEII